MCDNTPKDNIDAIIELIDVNMEEFAKPDAGTALSETETERRTEAETERRTEAETKRRTETETERRTESEAETEPRTNPETETDERERQKEAKGRRLVRELWSYLIIVAAAAFIAVVVSKFVIINAHIPSTSMVPTLKVDDRLIGFRLAYLFSEPQRGDVIIFRHSFAEDLEEEILVKRIIGVPGDTIRIDSGYVFVNGELLEEDYLAEPMNVLTAAEFTVPKDSYFVMGDNRNVSYDSRMWSNTYVSRDEIIARAVFKYYPRLEKVE